MCNFPALSIDGLILATTVNKDDRTAIMRIPESFVVGPLLDCLNASAGGRVKDTEFQEISIEVKQIDFVQGGLSIIIHVNGKFREVIWVNPFTGSKSFSPWLSVSGDVHAIFDARIENETIKLSVRDTKLFLDGPLRDLGDYLVDLVNGEQFLKGKIQEELNGFNGLTGVQLFKKYAPANINQRLRDLGIGDVEIQGILDRIVLDIFFTDIELNLVGRW